MGRIVVFVGFLLCTGCLVIKQPPKLVNTQPTSSGPYRHIGLEEMVRRYIAKSHQGDNSIEGIYSVSAEVIKKGRGLLSKEVRERTVDKKNNYATVAILKDWPGSNTEYVEISLETGSSSRFPIISEIKSLAGEGGYIFDHLDKNGKTQPFTFVSEGAGNEVLQGIYIEKVGNATITYKLSYLKTYPKNKNYASED